MRARNATSLFGLGDLAPAKKKALGIVYASSVALMMGVNFIQPALPALSGPFGISDSALALVMTVFTAPAIFLSPIFGVIADLYGRRLLLGWGLIVFGLFGASMALAPSFTWLLVLRTLQGVGFSAVIPLTIVLIGDLLEGDNEIGGQGLKVFLDRIGYLVFPPLGGLLATIAWFWPFVFYVLTVPVGVAALLWMPETKGKSNEKTLTYLGDMLRLARHPRLLVAFSAGFLRFFLDYGFLTYFPLFLVRTHGISTATAGLLYVFFSAGAMITASQAGRIAAGRDKAHILFMAFVVSGAAVVAVPFVPGVWLVGGALFFYGLANGVISPMQKSLLTQNAPTELRGGIVSFDRLIQQVSKTTSTSVVGLLLVTAELPTIFWMLGILSFASVGLMALLLPSPRHAVASPGAS
ncbi:MAG: MFS transporter [Deltaproteobacteria bacterium]|nr:MFS transporter [Deltaproteobacteria bacterium]MBI2533406.1 MFS transporter [Deltaproteobacteria bacterium]